MATIPSQPVRGRFAAAVTPHELSTRAALQVMGSGGNAVDGAIAANAVQGVVAPETCGIGGDLFALVYTPGEATPACLNASGRAGSGASAVTLRKAGHTEMPLYGPASVTIPGCVDGWRALSKKFGSRPLDELFAPALTYAIEGFETSTELARSWSRNVELLMSQPSASSMFPGGSPPERGQRITRPLLAQTLAAVIDGRDAYLRRMGAPVMAATDGWITEEDLARDQAEWVDPLGRELFGRTAWTVPPNSQGYLTLATLGIFELLDPPADPLDPVYGHALIEAYRSVIGERDDMATDPHTAPVPANDLVSDEYLEARATRVNMESASRWQCQSGTGVGGTAYLCTVDADGMAVSLIQSNYHGIGSGLSAGDTGVWLQNRGGGFTLTPGHPNELAPGRRPLHTLSPTVWTHGDRLELLLGTRGGHQQPQLLAQIAAHVFHAGYDLTAAQAQPRWTIDDHASDDSRISVESRFTPRVATGLSDRGHAITEHEPWMGGWGPLSVIRLDDADLREAAADPRVDTALAMAL